MALPSALQVRKYKGMMLEDLENALAEHAPAGGELASELPPLTIDGIPVSVDKMTQVRSCVINTSKKIPQNHNTRNILSSRGLLCIRHLIISVLEIVGVYSVNSAFPTFCLHFPSGPQVVSASKNK